MVLPFGMNMPLYISSAVLACGVPPRTATGRHRSVSDAMARMYSSRGRSSKVGSRSLPTTLSSSSWARGMNSSPNLTHASKKLAKDPADCHKSLAKKKEEKKPRGLVGTKGRVTHRLDAGPERRSSGVCDFQIRHAQTCLLAEEMRSKTLGRDTPGCLLPYLIHQLGVQCDILLPLLEHLGLPWGEDTGDVFQDGVAFDGELSGDAIFTVSPDFESSQGEKDPKKLT